MRACFSFVYCRMFVCLHYHLLPRCALERLPPHGYFQHDLVYLRAVHHSVALSTAPEIFHGRVIDVSQQTIMLELQGKEVGAPETLT